MPPDKKQKSMIHIWMLILSIHCIQCVDPKTNQPIMDAFNRSKFDENQISTIEWNPWHARLWWSRRIELSMCLLWLTYTWSTIGVYGLASFNPSSSYRLIEFSAVAFKNHHCQMIIIKCSMVWRCHTGINYAGCDFGWQYRDQRKWIRVILHQLCALWSAVWKEIFYLALLKRLYVCVCVCKYKKTSMQHLS